MKNGVPFRIDPELKDFLIEIQEQRLIAKTDKSKKNLTQISRIAWKVLLLQKNIDRMLKYRIPS